MRVTLTSDVEEFARCCRVFLAQRIERNLLATVLMLLQASPPRDAAPLFAYGLDDGSEVCFAALRTPPRPMIASEISPAEASVFLDAWLAVDPAPPGVNGLPATARAIAAAWGERTGRPTRCRMREAMHAVERVVDPARPARGEMRSASVGERELLVGWMGAFGEEVGVFHADEAERVVDGRLAQGGLVVWDDGGPVSLVGTSPQVAGVVRVGPVYTPPEHRRRGYAGSAVAAVSRAALAGGAGRCMLFTDLQNPTSNKIYAEVGYRRVGDWEEHAFG